MSDESRDQNQPGFELPIYKTQDCESNAPGPQVTLDMFNELQLELMQLRAEFARLRGQFEAEQQRQDGAD
ncbi:hypothetical protein OAI33_05180 [Pirellulaceae bacterium]|jgi:hypothetical protein|nr:hypothetical protein [Pirellulaceae bacterium]